MDINDNFCPYSTRSSTIFKKYKKNHEDKLLNIFSSTNSSNNLVENKILKNFKSNINISKPLTSMRNIYYSTKISFSNDKQNDFPSNYFSKTITSSKLFKKDKHINKKLTINTNTNYNIIDNNQMKKIFQINNKIFKENLKIKDKIEENKDYTNLLISKSETHYPMTTYYFSPSKNSFNLAVFINLLSNNKKNDNNYVNNSYEYNAQNNFFSPSSRKIIKNKSESENNIFFPKSNRCNKAKSLSNSNRISKNNIFNQDNSNDYYNVSTTKNKYKHGSYFKIEKKMRNIKEMLFILEKILNNKLFKLKEEFFKNLNRIINIDLIILNNVNEKNSSFPLKKNINQKLNMKSINNVKYQNDLLNNIYVNKKNSSHIYIPKKKSIKNSKNTSKINDYRNNKKQNVKSTNNYLTEVKEKNIKSLFKQRLKAEKINNNNRNKKIIQKNIFSSDNLIDNKNIFNNNIYNKNNNNKLLYETKKINEKNLSVKKVYQKKLGRNSTNKKMSKRPQLNLNEKLILNNKLNFNFNYGMLINYIISNDQKLNINVKYVVFINKLKNNNSKNFTSFIQSKFKVNKLDNLSIIGNVLIEYRNKKTINKIKKHSGLVEIKVNNIKYESRKKRIYFIQKKRFLFNYLKIKSLSILLKKHIYSLFLKKLRNVKVKPNYEINNQNEIFNNDNTIKNNEIILIKVKRAKTLKKYNKKNKNLEKCKQKIININNKMNIKIIEKHFKSWKNSKTEKCSQEIKNDSDNNKNKLKSNLNNDLFSIRLELICFALKKNK